MIYKWLDKLIIFLVKLGGRIMLNSFRQAWEWKKDKRLYIGFGISTFVGFIWWLVTGMKWGIFVFIPPWIVYIFVLGSIRTYADREEEKKKKEYNYKFDLAGIKHKDGSRPMVIEYTDEHITLLTYIDIHTLEGYKNKLESVFNINIDKFEGTKDKQVIRLILKQEINLPKILNWDNKYLLKDGIFNIGKDIRTGKNIVIDFNVNANLLIGGMPGSGKSKLVQLIIFQCLKNNAKVYIGDFKGGVDFMRFANKCDVITDHGELLKILKQFKREINNRIELFKSVGAENLREYNKITNENLKREYLVIDELGEALEIINEDLNEKETRQLKNDITNYLKSIARLGRAFGLNLICGTQRPDVGILEGQTRDQFGHRVCFKALSTTSNIVLNNKIASELPDNIKGRGIVMMGTELIETQVFLWNKLMLSEIKNKKLTKEDLKVIGESETSQINLQKNTNIEKDVSTIDFDID